MHAKSLFWAAFSLPVLSLLSPTTAADPLTMTWAHPRGSLHDVGFNLSPRQEPIDSGVPPLLANSTLSDIEKARTIVRDAIAQAAALVAEADAWADTKNGTLLRLKKRAVGNFWLGNLYHGGRWPYGNNPSDFTVFRDVTKYGAKGDGITVSSSPRLS
jgi:hypothetical protein